MAVPLNEAGLQSLRDKLQSYITVQGEVSAFEAAVVFDGYLKEELSTVGTGRIYRRLTGTRNKKGRFTKQRVIEHQASSPGDPPAVDTGFLRASVMIDKLPGGAATVEVTAPYAVALELGAPERNLEARPFFRVALRKAKDDMKKGARKARPGKTTRGATTSRG
jgi:hypothetical protein